MARKNRIVRRNDVEFNTFGEKIKHAKAGTDSFKCTKHELKKIFMHLLKTL